MEARANRFLPLLQVLLDRIPADELRSIHSNDIEGMNARRQLVWLTEKLLRLPETFYAAESLLLRLAIAESESGYTNNASGIWIFSVPDQSFRNSCSILGAIALLESRLREANISTEHLCIHALMNILTDAPPFGLVPPLVILGRIPPPAWNPSSPAEHESCHTAGMDLAESIAAESSPLAYSIRGEVVHHFTRLMFTCGLMRIKTILGSGPLPDQILASLTFQIGDFIALFGQEQEMSHTQEEIRELGNEKQSNVPESYQQDVNQKLVLQLREWYESLVPSTLHGRLVSTVGREPWQADGDDRNAWLKNLEELAIDFVSDPTSFIQESSWLASEAAKSSYKFGQALRQADPDGLILDNIITQACDSGMVNVARGYLDHCSELQSPLLGQLNDALDRLQRDHPLTLISLLWSARPQTQKIERVFQMIDSSSIPPERLVTLESDIRAGQCSREQLGAAIERLIDAAEKGSDRAGSAAVYLLYCWTTRNRQVSGEEQLRRDESLVSILKAVLEIFVKSEKLSSLYWPVLAKDLAAFDPDAAVRLITAALTTSDYDAQRRATQLLAELAPRHPTTVMSAIGETMLAPVTQNFHLIGDLSHLVGAVPVSTVKEWLGSNGLSRARAVARHLKPPRLSPDGEVDIPELTLFVLEQYEEDDQVFEEFLEGTHLGFAYIGELDEILQKASEIADRLLSHPQKRIREWSIEELSYIKSSRKYWAQRDEEKKAL